MPRDFFDVSNEGRARPAFCRPRPDILGNFLCMLHGYLSFSLRSELLAILAVEAVRAEQIPRLAAEQSDMRVRSLALNFHEEWAHVFAFRDTLSYFRCDSICNNC